MVFTWRTLMAKALLSLLLGICPGIPSLAHGQCILANPSFEINGSGGAVFGGWSQFGQVGRVHVASHGSQAARVSGPDSGGWGVSGFWQRLDSSPGEQWEAFGHVRHTSGSPLLGACAAIVNIEWRDSNGDLIDYDSFTVADAGTPTDEYFEFEVPSGPAPEGTVAIHFLVGVLQAPGEARPDVYYDHVNIFSTSSPTMDEQQWHDFPGGRSLDFAGRTWRVKGPGYYGPGPNVFSDASDCVWVDAGGRLHLTLSDRGAHWAATEVVLEDALGYGDYVVTTVGRLDLLDIHAVLGIFLWQYGPCWNEAYFWWNPYNEIDIEYSRWGDASNGIGQFVVQPWDWYGNMERFDLSFEEGELASHAVRWLADRVEYRVWRGGPDDESPESTVRTWTYSGPHVPRPEQPRMHLNLWKLQGTPGGDQEVVFQDFRFVPDGVVSGVEQVDNRDASRREAKLIEVAPNPSSGRIGITFSLTHEALVDLSIFSADGRRVRRLLTDSRLLGVQSVMWDGLDDRGRPVASGIYLVRLASNGFADARRVVIVSRASGAR